ncbi:MAG: ATP-dependent sacrificial sulfur transferase LarE [Verrucomicrobiae bacterium]|nr:ATP-dependent sacrificial sulfur transferase LarE [Verrucomicrobiae bacterium]
MHPTDPLRKMIRNYGRLLVAYSGGVDSAFLLKVAVEELGRDAMGVIADSPSYPRREFESAMALAEGMGARIHILRTAEMDNPEYARNPVNRCYFCKHELFSRMGQFAAEQDWPHLAYGEIAEDAADFRPGAQAAREFQVHAPLREAGLTKADIRRFSAELGLPTADKPAMACLSSRIPYGQPVREDSLRMIETAENFIRDQGFYDVRVRHHLHGSETVARVEVGIAEVPRLQEPGMDRRVRQTLHTIGYDRVEIDPLGYRRGSLNPAG